MIHLQRLCASSVLLPSLLLIASPAQATYSIVAADTATQQVGGAVTSCVGAQGVTIVYGPAPGFGGINAQAAANTNGRNRGVQLLQMGTAPADIIQQITASSFDPSSASRQYGVVDLQGRAAGFTGASCLAFADDLTGSVGTFTYAIQGNILTSGAVLTQAQAAFVAQGCDLAERLMRALEGGAQNGEGDSRCTELSTPVPANAASIEVDLAGQTAGSYLRLSNAQAGSVNAVVRLRSQFDTWRMTHPCPGPNDGGTDADAGTMVDAGRDAAVDGDAMTGADVARDAPLDVSTDVGMPEGSAGAAGADTGGTAGASGTAGAAGSSGRGGAAGAPDGGGTGASGGASGAAGRGGAGGASGSGGATGGSAGASATGGSSGTTGRGGSGGSGPSTGGASGSGNRPTEETGCSCRVHPTNTGAVPLAWVVSLMGLALTRSRYRRRAK